jgi:hypothetical protein
MTTINKQTVSVTTDCQCGEYFDEDSQKYLPIEDCSGDCYEWQKEDVFTLLGEWQLLNNVDEDDIIRINASSVGWQGRSGYKDTDILELHGALALNGDFRIEWYLEGNDLTARRWSHDEPVGTGIFTFDILKGCDKCGDLIQKDIHAEELGMCVECSHAYFDHKED